jgi:mannose-6-phosphate isomerase-like protein (cupin superfamily)
MLFYKGVAPVVGREGKMEQLVQELAADKPGDAFARDGFITPVRLLTEAQCALTMAYFRSGAIPEPVEWDKGMAVSERFVFDIATRPALVGKLRRLLGDDIILWGAIFAERGPNAVHPWHCDFESSAPQGGFVSVWIGLENMRETSALKLVPGSHQFGRTIQEVQASHGYRRSEADDARVVEWARDYHPEAELIQPDLENGEAIVFDGRLWHGSQNHSPDKIRTALLLQYTRGNTSVYMPDLTQLEWPPRLIVDQRPPVLRVCGQADEVANRVEPEPCLSPPEIATGIFTQSLSLPLERDLESGWHPLFLFNGPTASLQHLTCHVSVLESGHCPHPPHAHIEEEILVVLDGEGQIVIASSPDDPAPRSEHFVPGDFVYHPAFQHHTIRNTGAHPVTYLMFKWRSTPLETETILGSTVVRLEEFPPRTEPQPFDTQFLFEEPTAFLSKLHAHLTDLQPGAGYEPHADDYDVAIVLLSGQIATVDATLTAPAIAFYARDELHGMQNPGDTVARYVVFEFHGDEAPAARRQFLNGRPAHDHAASDENIDSLRKERELLIAENEKLSAEGEAMRAQLGRVLYSRSWRYTSPLRAVLWAIRHRLFGLD